MKDVVQSAVQQINAVGCVNIELASASALDYVSVQLGSNYSSHIGRQGGPQNMTVVAKTIDRGTVMHEFLHSLGIYDLCSFENMLMWKKSKVAPFLQCRMQKKGKTKSYQ